MQERGSYLGFCGFCMSVVIIVIIGSVLLYYDKQKIREESESISSIKDAEIKKDTSKDYIYFENEESIVSEYNITNKDVVININSEDANKVQLEIDSYLKTIKNSKVSISVDKTCSNGESLYSTDFLDFSIYEYDDYVSLLIMKSSYDCNNGISTTKSIMSYTFDITDGTSLSNNNIMALYNTNFSKILTKVRERLNDNQSTMSNGNNLIKITDTISDLKENETYAIFINKDGKLEMKYIVKTNSIDYNDSIEIEE